MDDQEMNRASSGSASETFKRRRWRFGLRTLFLVVTAVALWLGWNVYQLQKRAGVAKFILTSSGSSQAITYGPPVRPWKSLPATWRLLGVKLVTYINLSGVKLEDEDIGQIQASFPEAEFTWD